MSGTFPSAMRPSAFRLGGNAPTMVSVTHSLTRQTRSRGAHRFMPWMRFGLMKLDEWSPIVAFLELQRGQFDKFELPVFGRETPRGSASGAVSVNAAHSKGAMSVALKGLALSVTGIFKARDLLRFAGHKKLYAITADANSDGSGHATVALNCPLLSDLSNNEAVSFTNLTVAVALVSDTIPDEWGGGIICPGFEIQMVEDPL